MLQQDYILRLIREFFDALTRAKNKADAEKRALAIQQLYRQYLGSYEFYQNTDVEEAISYIGTLYPEEQRVQRLEMLAELYYAEADCRATPIGQSHLQRALDLFTYVDLHSDTYSIMRQNKINAIRMRIGS